MPLAKLPRIKLKLHQRHCLLTLSDGNGSPSYPDEHYQLRAMGLADWQSPGLTDRGRYYAEHSTEIDLDRAVTTK